MRRTIFAAALILALTGCVERHGNEYDSSKVAQLRPGVSTETDAIGLLGTPVSSSSQADGGQLLQWYYVYGNSFGGSGGANTAILFGPDKKMIRVVQQTQM